MKPIYLNDWAEDYVKGKTWKVDSEDPRYHLMADFEIKEEDMIGVNILLASYTYECYEGDAFVLFEKGGNLYEVNAGHCSCYGLEGQWEPEDTTVEALEHRLNEGVFGVNAWYNEPENKFAVELREVLSAIKGGI
jgi:hypothetical protein